MFFSFPIILSLYRSQFHPSCPICHLSFKTLIRISRDIFHCLLVTETLIKSLGPFASQVHGTLPCISGNERPSSTIHNAHTVFSSEIFLYLTFLTFLGFYELVEQQRQNTANVSPCTSPFLVILISSHLISSMSLMFMLKAICSLFRFCSYGRYKISQINSSSSSSFK